MEWIHRAGVSQKDLQLGNTNNGKKALEKLAEKGRAHCKLELGAVRLYIRKCGDSYTRFMFSGKFKNVSFVSALEKVVSKEILYFLPINVSALLWNVRVREISFSFASLMVF